MKTGDWANFFSGWTVTKTVVIQKRYIDEIIRNTTVNSSLLEIGAGSGLTSLALFYSGRKNIVVSDRDVSVLSRLSREFPELKVERADMFNINSADGSFFCIYHQGLMEHFSDSEIVESLKEQARVAKMIIFDVPNDRRWNKVQEFGDERFLSVQSWTRLIKMAGLRVIRVTGRRLPKLFDFLPHLLQNSEWVNKIFGTSSIFVCIK